MNKPKIVRLTFALASLFAVTLASAQSMQSAVDAPQAPPQLRYIVIDLGARVANAISESGRISARRFLEGRYMPRIGTTARAHQLISAHCQVSPQASRRILIHAAKSWERRVVSQRFGLYFGQAVEVRR